MVLFRRSFLPFYLFSILLGCSGDGVLKSDRAPEPLDTSDPQNSMGQLKINNDSASTLSKNVQVSLQASNTKLNITHFCLRSNSTTEPTSSDVCWNSVSDPTPGLTPSKNLTLTNFPFSLGNAPGFYTVFAWIKDALGNISSLTNSSEGTAGRDKDSIYYDVGTSPSVTSFTVTNGTAGGNFGTTTFAAGNIVNISWTVTDAEGLADAPVSLYYSTNNSTFTNVIALGSDVGTTSGNPTTWTSSYNVFTAPGATFFRLRLVVTDAVGNTTTAFSTSLNTSKWSIFAGTAASGDGDLATAAEFGHADLNGPTQNIVQTKNGDIYIAYLTAIRKITASTGLISTYMTFGSEQNIPGTVGTAPLPRFNAINTGLYGSNMIKDNNDNLYIVGPTTVGGTNNGRIYKINTNTNAISIYAGGGSSNANNIPGTSAIVMDYAKLSINPNNNDIYFMSTCDVNNRGTTGYIIRKITQNSDGTPGEVTTIGGDCTRGWPADGAVALSSPLENTQYTYMHGLFYSPSTNAVYYSTINTNGIYKIVNGKIYKISATYYANSFVYSSKDNVIYATTDLGPLIKIVPTANEAADDVVSIHIANHNTSTSATCNQDGVLLTNACALASSPFITSNGALGFEDGPMRNQRYSMRVRIVDEENKIKTVAGLMGMTGHGKDKLMAKFSRIRRLVFKSTGAGNQTLFPGGLYIGDGGANAIGYIDLSTNIFTHRAGNMVSRSATTGSTFSANVSIGGNYSATAGGIFSFDAAGLMTFYGSSYYIYRVDSSGLIQSVLTGTGNYYNAADGATASSMLTQYYGSWAGMPYDNNGNLYIGPQTSSLSGAAYIPKFMRVNIATNKIYKVMGGTLNATSADDATAGSAISKNFACSNGTTGTGACQMEYDTTNDRLLFAEGNKIRYITTPYNTAASTLRTLLDAGRAVGAFSYVPGNNWVYYLSGTSLYCYDLSAVNPAGCNNTAISISAQLGNLSIETITRDASGNVYVINSAANLVYKYVP